MAGKELVFWWVIMTRMRIAFFTDSFYPRVNGVTVYVGAIARALMAMGHEVMIVAPEWKDSSHGDVQKFVPGARVVLVPGITAFFYQELKMGTPTPKALGEVRKFMPDIIHFHTPALMSLEATLLARLLKIPLVATFHTYYMEPEGFAAIGLREGGAVSKILQESLWKISERIHAPCDMVIAPTQYVGKDLQSRWKKTNIQVIPGAVDLKPFGKHGKRRSLRKKYGLDKALVFLSVGRLSVEKHYDVLITAFSMILMKYPSARLVFVGGGPARKELEYITNVLGIDRAVLFVGEVPYKELAAENYYSMADVFVTPSTWDTQGLSVVEAMASGLPIVAFNFRAMPEVVGKGGILVKHLDQYGFAKAMGKLAGNKKLREKLGKLAVAESKKYNIDNHVEDLMTLYMDLVEKKKQ